MTIANFRNISCYLISPFVVCLFLCTSCESKGHSELQKALSTALAKDKISKGKMEAILKEYDMLREADKAKAHDYVLNIVNAIEMGGDSSHIDVARKQVSKPAEVRI